MAQPSRPTLSEQRDLVRQLRQLGDAATPPDLTADILFATGLADRYFALPSPLGRIFVAYSQNGVTRVSAPESVSVFEEDFARAMKRRVFAIANPPRDLMRAIERRLRENSRDVAFDLRGLTDFERAVLTKALEIPYGEVRPYGWIAREIGHPGAVRAVGTALGHNPVPLLIPCHRVVRSDGYLGEYSLGGRANKRTMLAAEGIDPDALEHLARSGIRFYGSDTTHIFCFPTCRHARRVTDAHRVTFPSVAAAESAGYRPCRVCRPAQAAS